MTTCEICGRPEGIGEGMCQRDTMRWAPDEAANCYRIGFEREKARADALAAKLADATARLGSIFEPGSAATASLDAMLTRLRAHSVRRSAPTDHSRLREVHEHLTAHGLPALDRMDAEDDNV